MWHEGLHQNLKYILRKQYTEILKYYLTEKYFRIREIKVGVPKCSVLGPPLYLLYTCDIPGLNNTVITYANDATCEETAKSYQ